MLQAAGWIRHRDLLHCPHLFKGHHLQQLCVTLRPLKMLCIFNILCKILQLQKSLSGYSGCKGFRTGSQSPSNNSVRSAVC